MSGNEHEPPVDSDLNEEEIEVIGQVLRELIQTDEMPDLVQGVFAALDLSEEGQVSNALQASQDDLPPPDLVEGVFKQLALSEQLQDFGRALRDGQENDDSSSLDTGVIRRIEPNAETLTLSSALQEACSDTEKPEIENGVIQALGLVDSSQEVRALLREMVFEQSAPDLVDGVMAELGLDEALPLGELLGPESSPDLWAGIESEIGSSAPVAQSPKSTVSAPVLSFQEERERRSHWLASSAVWAAAAAALLFAFWDGDDNRQPISATGDEMAMTVSSDAPEPTEVAQNQRVWTENDSGLTENGSDLNSLAVGSSEDASSDDWELEPNDVVIENVDSDGGAFVQVLQFDEDAPPIIFITELDDGQLEDSEGATL